MSCEGSIIKEIVHKGVTLAVEAWHPTNKADRKDECSACEAGSSDYGWFVVSEIVNNTMEEITVDPLVACPTNEELEHLAERIAAKDEIGLDRLIRNL